MVQLIKLLLQDGMDIEAVDKQGRTPLFYCRGDSDIKDILLKHGYLIIDGSL